MTMQHYRLNHSPKALPGRIGAELSRFVQHTNALVVTMIEVAPPHHRRHIRATVLSVPFPATKLFEEHVLPKLLLGDSAASADDLAYSLVKTLPPRPEWKRRWILTAGPQAQIPPDALFGTPSAGVAFHYNRRGVVGVFSAAQDEPERLATFTKAGWSVSAAPPSFLTQAVMALQLRPIAFQPFLWGEALAEQVSEPLLTDGVALSAPSAPVLRSAAPLRPRPQALATADARGFPLGVSATGQSLQLVWNAATLGVDAAGDRLAHALQSFAARALEKEINVIAVLPRDLNVQYALLPLEDAERVLVFDGKNRWKSASLPWQQLSPEQLMSLLRRHGGRLPLPEALPGTFREVLTAAGIPAMATEAIRILTSPEGDDLQEVISFGNGVLLLLDEPTDLLAADLLLELIAATGVRRPMLLIRPEGIAPPRLIAEVAIQLVVEPKTMRLMLRDGGDHWMFEEYGALPVMMLADLMAEGQTVEGVEEDLVEGLGRNLVPNALPRSDAEEAPLDVELIEEPLVALVVTQHAEASLVEPEIEAVPPVAVEGLSAELATLAVEAEQAVWGDLPGADEPEEAIVWGNVPALDTLVDAELALELPTLEASEGEPVALEETLPRELLLAHQNEGEAGEEGREEQILAMVPAPFPAEDERLEGASVDARDVELDDGSDEAVPTQLTVDSERFDEGDELAPVQFEEDDATLDLGALGLSLPRHWPDYAAGMPASVLSLPSENGLDGPISEELEAPKAVLADVFFAHQDANKADIEALQTQSSDGSAREAVASARRRVTAGHRGRRRMPAVAHFATQDVEPLPEPEALAVVEVEPLVEAEVEPMALGEDVSLAKVEEPEPEAPALVEGEALAQAEGEAPAELAALAEVELVADPELEPLALGEDVPLAEVKEPELEAPALVEGEALAQDEPLDEALPLAELAVVAEVELVADPEPEPLALVEGEAEQESLADVGAPLSLVVADAAFAMGDLDAAEAAYRAIMASAQTADLRAARLGLGRVIAARRNPQPVVAPPAEPVPVAVLSAVEPVVRQPAAEDRWSDDALFAAWSRGESIVRLARAYAADNPALTLAGAMARVREVVTLRSATVKTVESHPAEPRGTISLDTPLPSMTNGSSTDIAGFLSPMTNGSSAFLDCEHAQEVRPDAAFSDAYITSALRMTNGSSAGYSPHLLHAQEVRPDAAFAEANEGGVEAGLLHAQEARPDAAFAEVDDGTQTAGCQETLALSADQLAALIERLQADEQSHRTTRAGRAIRTNWRKGFTIREHLRALHRFFPDADDEALKQMVEEAVIPAIMLEHASQLPQIVEAVFDMLSNDEARASLEQILLTLTQSTSMLRGSVRQRALDRVRRYLQHCLHITPNAEVEVLHAA